MGDDPVSDLFTSVWEDSDSKLLPKMIEFYSKLPGTPILDATFNAGKMWKGTGIRPVTMDMDPQYGTDYVCDNQVMPGVPDYHFGVVVYDPPHCGDNGRDKSTKNFDGIYGCNQTCLKEQGYTLSHLYPGFLTQAKRVMLPEGIVLAKITDQVNSHRSRWAHVDFMVMAEKAGFTVCDLIVKVRKGPMMSSTWNHMRHARKRHCFWIVLRNGRSCE